MEIRKYSKYLFPLIILAGPIISMIILAGCAGTPPSGAVTGQKEDAGKVVENGPGLLSAGAVIFDATIAAQNSEYEKAEEMLTGLLGREPDNLEAMRLLARVYTADGDRKSATRTWERVYELDPSDPDAAYETGTMLQREKRWSEVRTEMMKTESLGGADSRHFLLIGRAGLELGYRDEAEVYLLKAGNLELATALLGKLYYGRGKTKKAEAAFKKTLGRNPDNYIANLHLGYISFNSGRKEEALGYYAKAHKSDPDDPLACLSLASLHEKMSHDEAAIKYYKKALGLKNIPRAEKQKVYVSLSKLFMKTGRTDDIFALVRDGIEEFPSSGGLYFYWGEALLKQGRKTEAKEKYKKASHDPTWKKHALARFHSIR
ncbi:MAG: tetratricopeptide repeat protein [Candidatus Krumholzibacteriota bacterium]|nr:tetratricopeptide repeat protein [Candidatus Krumholzibacteriota bacterium]